MAKSDKYIESQLQAPKISVIIPLYNTDKFIGQCLDSILNQTFQDYEVIVVDDCSTDNSVAIVEKMMPKFNGRLKLFKHKKNSGGCAIPRNTGIKLARGKYLAFMDSDDMFLRTALEELYNAAESTDADVVHEEKFLITSDRSEEVDSKTPLSKISWERKDENGFVKKPTLISDNLFERLQKYGQGQFCWNIWSKLFRREFVIENCLEFVNLSAEDMIFSFQCLCLAKNYVRVPNVVYFYRIRQDSIAHRRPPMEEYIPKQLKIIIDGSKYLRDFMKGFEIFDQHLEFKQNVLDIFIREHFRHLRKIYAETPIHEINQVLYKEFLGASNVDAELISYFFSEASLFRLLFEQAQHHIGQLEEELAKLKK